MSRLEVQSNYKQGALENYNSPRKARCWRVAKRRPVPTPGAHESTPCAHPDLFEKLRLVITEESFLLISGKLQNIDNVIHVRAKRIERLAHQELVGSASYDFH